MSYQGDDQGDYDDQQGGYGDEQDGGYGDEQQDDQGEEGGDDSQDQSPGGYSDQGGVNDRDGRGQGQRTGRFPNPQVAAEYYRKATAGHTGMCVRLHRSNMILTTKQAVRVGAALAVQAPEAA